MDKEWYLLEYEEKQYLHNKTLSLRSYPCVEESHDHCELCWAKFSKYQSDHHIGYYEPLSKSWICSDCYHELASLFGWVEND